MLTIDGLTLPDGLLWIDEFESSLINQSVYHSLGGRQFTQQQTLQTNRAITLSGGVDHGFAERSIMIALRAMANDGLVHLLTIQDGRTFNVLFDNGNNEIVGTLILLKSNPLEEDLYNNVSIRLIEA